MEINGHWKEIQKIFKKSIGYYYIATVNPDGTPHVTPIGSVYLRDDRTGFWFDYYSSNMVRNLKYNNRVCVMAADTSKLMLLWTLFRGKYAKPPAVRLMGTAGERREATEKEMAAFHDNFRVKPVRLLKLKGYDIAWKPMRHVRDIYFDSFEPVIAGETTAGHWGLL